VTIVKSAGVALIWPRLVAMIANSVAPAEQGKVNGVSTSLSGLMRVFGSLWAGTAYDHISPGTPYWVAAALFVIAMVLFVRIRGVAGAQASSSSSIQAQAGD
jgi:predicted MFS family arabinose efflux permease